MPRLHVIVSGRVQGVFYRVSTRDKASELGLVGWVRNCADGKVEIVAEGDDAALSALEAWCHRGPMLAKVTSVDAERSPSTGEFSAFEIQR